MSMVDNHHQHHLFIIVTEAENLINTTDTRITKITDLTAKVDLPADHIATSCHTETKDLTVTIDLKTDTIIELITVADHKAITEITIIMIIQTPENAATAKTEVIVNHIIIMIANIIIIIIKTTTRNNPRINSRSPYQSRSPPNKKKWKFTQQ